jgi:Cysteinyl-tRNA synthetase
MDDGLTTADGLSALFARVRDIPSNVTRSSCRELVIFAKDLFSELTGVLGLVYEDRDHVLVGKVDEPIAARTAAREPKEFGQADSMRDEIAAMAVVLEDTRHGVEWLIKCSSCDFKSSADVAFYRVVRSLFSICSQ